MELFLDYLKLCYPENSPEILAILRIIEKLYFSRIKSPFRRLQTAEEFRIARDIVALERFLDSPAAAPFPLFKSKLLEAWLHEKTIPNKSELTPAKISTIRADIVTPNRHYVTAAFILDIVNRQHKQERLKWIIAVLLTILSTFVALGIAILKEAPRVP